MLLVKFAVRVTVAFVLAIVVLPFLVDIVVPPYVVTFFRYSFVLVITDPPEALVAPPVLFLIEFLEIAVVWAVLVVVLTTVRLVIGAAGW